MRRPWTLEEREEIAVGRVQGLGVWETARRINRAPSVVSREIRRNISQRGYRASADDRRAAERRRRSQQCLLEGTMVPRERVLADLRPWRASRSRRQVRQLAR
ncbi:helix-turn-helix domain-containing protein [Streptomyces sp. NPDC055085]